MSNQPTARTFEGQSRVRKAIEKYLKARGMTSTRKVAAYVTKETGIPVSASTISRLVRKFGYDRAVVEWEHVEQSEEWVKK